jgi:hypothetical protein
VDGSFNENGENELPNETNETDDDGDRTVTKSIPTAITNDRSPEVVDLRKNADGDSPSKSFKIPKKKKPTVPIKAC